jgi:erythromycin esterase-like protein
MRKEILQARQGARSVERPVDLNPLVERVRGARVVLIGEASHGTHDYYDLRASLSRQLIAKGGVSSVAIEADQARCVLLDKSVRLVDGAPDDPAEVLTQQRQWPSWMLANNETVEFCRWLREYNKKQPPENRVSLHGLDVYPLWGAMNGVVQYLSRELGWSPDEVNNALDAPLRGKPMLTPDLISPVAAHLAATLPDRSPVMDAQSYYQNLLTGGDQTMIARSELWLGKIDSLQRSQRQTTTLVWAHNTHVGDARGTNSSAATIGQLVRERYGQDAVALIGFAGGTGTVMAVRERGVAMDIFPVSEPQQESVEAVLRDASAEIHERTMFVFPERRDNEWFTNTRGHRAFGVVYNDPNGFPVPTRLGERYDAILWCNQTTALEALHLDEARQGTLETLRMPR